MFGRVVRHWTTGPSSKLTSRTSAVPSRTTSSRPRSWSTNATAPGGERWGEGGRGERGGFPPGPAGRGDREEKAPRPGRRAGTLMQTDRTQAAEADRRNRQRAGHGKDRHERFFAASRFGAAHPAQREERGAHQREERGGFRTSEQASASQRQRRRGEGRRPGAVEEQPAGRDRRQQGDQSGRDLSEDGRERPCDDRHEARHDRRDRGCRYRGLVRQLAVDGI